MITPTDVALIMSIGSTLLFIVSTLCVPSEKLYPKLSELMVVLCMATFIVTCYTWIMWWVMSARYP